VAKVSAVVAKRRPIKQATGKNAPRRSLLRVDRVLVKGRKNGNAAKGATRSKPAIVVKNPQRTHLLFIPKRTARRTSAVGKMSMEPKTYNQYKLYGLANHARNAMVPLLSECVISRTIRNTRIPAKISHRNMGSFITNAKLIAGAV
jgi:hypothetical protein